MFTYRYRNPGEDASKKIRVFAKILSVLPKKRLGSFLTRKEAAKAEEMLEITTGNSLTLPPYLYHRFYTKAGTGDLIIGEVSKINDYNIDNVFASPRERLSSTEGDEPPYRLLVNEYV